MSAVIKVENLSKEYRLGTIGHGMLFKDLQSGWARLRGKEDPNAKVFGSGKAGSGKFLALDDISFDVLQGEVLGLIGRNGAGKSTLLKILSRITAPSKGKVSLRGRVASLLEVGTGFHPELTGRENAFLNGAILGMSQREVRSKFDEIVAFADIEQFIDTPVKRYSSGMYVRLAFAVAAHLESEILIIDEVLAVGDAQFQRKCLGKMDEVSKQKGRTVLFVSHNMEAVRQICQRVALLKNGRIEYDGHPINGIAKYLNQVQKITATTAIHDQSFRRGSGTLRVTSFLLRGKNGRETTSLKADTPFAIEFEYTALAAIEGLAFSLYLRTAEGGSILIRMNKILTERNLRENSRGTVKVLVNGLHLPPGIYPVYFFLSDKKSFLSDLPVHYEVLDNLISPIVVQGLPDRNVGLVDIVFRTQHVHKD